MSTIIKLKEIQSIVKTIDVVAAMKEGFIQYSSETPLFLRLESYFLTINLAMSILSMATLKVTISM